MQFEELMKWIELPKEAREVARAYRKTGEEFETWKKLYQDDFRGFMKAWKDTEHAYEWLLSFYLELGLELYDSYQKEGISDQVFTDSMKDITIWCLECKRIYGVWGLSEVYWIACTLKQKLYRLGRLQFEPVTLEVDYVDDRDELFKELDPAPKKGQKVLNVHIPAGEPLSIEACMESFRQAEFFFNDDFDAYVCDSWLLAPELKKLMSQEANIIQFQNLFTVTHIHHRFRQAEQRVFGVISEDITSYPEETSLQKNLKKYIISGREPGIGIGFINRR